MKKHSKATRIVIALAASAAVAAPLAMGVTSATAGQNASVTDETTSATSTVDWDVNANGWNITIQNNSGTLLTNKRAGNLGVKDAQEKIGTRQAGKILGHKSSFFSEGPADLHAPYTSGDLANGWNRYVRVSSTKSGEVTVDCGVVKTGNSEGRYVGCQLTTGKQLPSEPVLVTFTPLPDGPWKK